MAGYRCNVTGAVGTQQLAEAKPPVLCDTDPSQCVSGAKQLVYWHQADGNNVDADVDPCESLSLGPLGNI